ncbi:hypothetical protein BgAZ_305160 [Babesia gibsoni]|uniref:RRM domain-containing protein n=1 Tax=Babesia gibsoni TaxID=33632 RepID=A0AAD8PD63_BABGI|nr:hypothetical protein BgAZ_305160 [Babesia gibsoni]
MEGKGDNIVILEDELKMLQGIADTQMADDSVEAKENDEVDRRSVYVGNVDYSTKPYDLQEFFKASGQINRITIMVDKWSGKPKGYAYIEFANEDAVNNALMLNDCLFKERIIKASETDYQFTLHRGGRYPSHQRGGYRGGYGKPY